jgi:2-dehydro-3-deoxygluconokinase
VTGITAALTESTGRTVAHAVGEAARRGVKVALDVNYRSLLWTPEKARSVLEPLLEHASILFCSRLDGIKVFGVQGDGPAVNAALSERYRLDHVVSTDGTAGCYYSGVEGQRIYAIEPVRVTDRPGAGDAFVGGALHGYLGDNVMQGVDFGLRTSKLALTHHGDLTHVTPGELQIAASTDILR